MSKLFILIFFSISLFASDEISRDTNAITPNVLDKIRTNYYSGVENENYIDSLQALLSNYFSDNKSKYSAIGLAYSAGVEALKSKHSFWPFNKMSYLNSSMDLFALAVKQEPNNLEIRFLRYSILHYVPGILGYSDELKDDQKVILKLLAQNQTNNITDSLKEGIINFLFESGRLSKNEINSLHSINVSLLK